MSDLALLVERLLPTRVGMARIRVGRRAAARAAPHTRGDGPAYLEGMPEVTFCSPHAWGWPATRATRLPEARLLPTRVGMARSSYCNTTGELTKLE